MSARMDPIRDEHGNLRPDMDYRIVPLATMAAYLGIHKDTLYRRVLNKQVPQSGIVMIGRFHHFKPRVVVA